MAVRLLGDCREGREDRAKPGGRCPFRHWWVVVSLLLTIVAVLILAQETSVIGRSAATALAPATSSAALLALQPTLPHSIGGLLVLLDIQWLNVFKPEGLTPYGWRRLKEERARLQGRAVTRPGRAEVETPE